MTTAQRNNLLKMLGIDVWVSRADRPPPGEAFPEPAAAPIAGDAAASGRPEEAVAGSRAPEPDVSALTSEMRESLKSSSGRSSNLPVDAARETSRPQAPRADAPADDLPACRILCLAVADGLLLAEAQELKATRRLGRDLLAALDGNWQKPPTETVFDWPPQQAVPESVSGKRALTAFIARQLDELPQDGVIVACARLGTLLPELAGFAAQRGQRIVEINQLSDLASDATAKRNLWLQIQKLNA